MRSRHAIFVALICCCDGAATNVTCPNPAALGFLRHQIAYERTEESSLLKGLLLIHANVLMRGSITGFYIRERLAGAIPTMRLTYVFGKDGLRGGGSCPQDKKWRACIGEFADREFAGDPAYTNGRLTTCTVTIDVSSIPSWRPSPNDQTKRRLARELRDEIEAKCRGVEGIVVRDFNLQDNQITMYLKMPDAAYYQGCRFHAMRRPHCDGGHLFGQAPVSALRKWIFERPYRLK